MVLPADRTKSGIEEKVRIGFSWEVVATRPMSSRDRTQWEIDSARERLRRATDRCDGRKELTVQQEQDLHRTLTHAVRAWCRTHLRCKDARSDDGSQYLAFGEKAPEDLYHTVTQARAAIRQICYRVPRTSTAKIVETVQGAVDAVLDAASRPPRNRRRFPARLRTDRVPRKPRVRPGSWIDTGRYRPAVVLAMMPDPPHIMKLSYGDETDEDFRPHVTNWKSVRKRKRAPSLRDVFEAGNWIRHPYNGYGRLLAVRNSTMDVDYRGRVATAAPGSDLLRWKKVDDPGPRDSRPVGERLPPGTWVETDRSGQGVVLAVEDDVLAVLFPYGVARIVEPGIGDDGPVIWKLERKELDLHSSWGRRWAWWWLHEDIFRTPVCACCGYPTFGQRDDDWDTPGECVICGYPDFGTGFEHDDVPRVLLAGGYWRYRGAWDDPEQDEPDFEPSDQEWDASGYGLSEARHNFETRGVMFRSGDANVRATPAVAGLRRSLVQLLDSRMAEPSGWNDDDDRAIEQLKQDILTELETARAVPRGGEQR